MGILSGHAIREAVAKGDIDITPWNDRLVNPASVDLRLGGMVSVPRVEGFSDQDMLSVLDGDNGAVLPLVQLDARKKSDYFLHTMSREKGILLQPNRLYLMHTIERVHTKKYVPVLDGKSSIGRLGIQVHLTAGYGDPGFDGQFTLEVACIHPVRVFPTMQFCQLRFHAVVGEVLSYQSTGRYKGAQAEGPIPSRSWEQFEEQVAKQE
jgi:dCTP deaminase